jgi:hypothetical protein
MKHMTSRVLELGLVNIKTGITLVCEQLIGIKDIKLKHSTLNLHKKQNQKDILHKISQKQLVIFGIELRAYIAHVHGFEESCV